MMKAASKYENKNLISFRSKTFYSIEMSLPFVLESKIHSFEQYYLAALEMLILYSYCTMHISIIACSIFYSISTK